ncbi:MAG: U32 family peptidase, partial [Candidatus Omnitrophica bacterium]|nr:U32 family peptidase [Candidatus Omnitrophota bacterium]
IDCDVETFIHGAMCVSVSGRCLLSEHTFHKSANRGKCVQPCRREYVIKDTRGESEYIIGKDYVLSPKDLCTIMFIDKLIDAGIHSFKIEGRIRSSEYVKETVRVYRSALDAYCEGKLTELFKKSLYKKLQEFYNRGFSNGFYLGGPKEWYSRDLENEYEKVFIGTVEKYYPKIGVAEVVLSNGGIVLGDKVLFLGKSTQAEFIIVEEMQIRNRFIERAEKGAAVGIKVPFAVKSKDKLFAWKRV